jgi:peroxiredoxin
VRELALATLEAERNPQLFDAARTQLTDADPMVRLTGLNYLRKIDAQRGVPIFISLLDDSDLRIVAAAELALSRWTGEDYGVRARLAIAPQEGDQAGRVDPGNVEAIHKGVEQRKHWWQVHSKEFPASPSGTFMSIKPDFNRPPATDFRLNDINGRALRLNDLRGKVVLLNFWATWCPACITEIPDLVALQREHGQEIAVVGVSLDGVPDEEGEQEETQGHNGKPDRSVKSIQAKVARIVQARGINYPVLLDPHGSVGGQYNGGELPTTVLIDKEGRVRRRFIGDRSPAVLAAMIAQIQ